MLVPDASRPVISRIRGAISDQAHHFLSETNRPHLLVAVAGLPVPRSFHTVIRPRRLGLVRAGWPDWIADFHERHAVGV